MHAFPGGEELFDVVTLECTEKGEAYFYGLDKSQSLLASLKLDSEAFDDAPSGAKKDGVIKRDLASSLRPVISEHFHGKPIVVELSSKSNVIEAKTKIGAKTIINREIGTSDPPLQKVPKNLPSFTPEREIKGLRPSILSEAYQLLENSSNMKGVHVKIGQQGITFSAWPGYLRSSISDGERTCKTSASTIISSALLHDIAVFQSKGISNLSLDIAIHDDAMLRARYRFASGNLTYWATHVREED